jgi:hypothetical protein
MAQWSDAVKSKFLLKALGKKYVCGNVQTLVSECRPSEGGLEARQRRTTKYRYKCFCRGHANTCVLRDSKCIYNSNVTICQTEIKFIIYYLYIFVRNVVRMQMLISVAHVE